MSILTQKTLKSLLVVVVLTVLTLRHTAWYPSLLVKSSSINDPMLVKIADYEEEFVYEESNLNVSKLSNIKTKHDYENWYEQLTANFPLNLIQNRTQFKDPKGCTHFPEFLDLKFNNIYWQTLTKEERDLAYFLSAYYDNRDLVENRPIIRILSFIKTVNIPSVKFCLIWFQEDETLVRSNVTSSIMMDIFESLIHMYLLSCEIPQQYNMYIPAAVSLVENECDNATNVLKVNYNLPKEDGKKDFAICIKAMDYPHQDLSFYLVQYIELSKLLGIHKIFIYNYITHPNMSSVLRYYENQGQVQVIPMTVPGKYPNLGGLLHELLRRNITVKRLAERIPHNDCFYRNIYRYKYIAFFDLDEIMIPYEGKTWKQLIDGEIKKNKTVQGSKYEPPSAYIFGAAMKIDSLRKPFGWDPDIPKYMSMLQNVYRTDPISYWYTKQIIDTERNLGISNHIPMRCIGTCKMYYVPVTEAYMSHYRNNCKRKCKNVTKDTNIWEYGKEKMIENVDKSLKIIGLL